MEVLVYKEKRTFLCPANADFHNKRSLGILVCMEQHCGRRIELRLTKKQERLCRQSCAVARRAYNWQLAIQNANYEAAKRATPEGQKVKCKLGSPIDWHKDWCVYKKQPGNEWITKLSKFCGQEALRDLGVAWQKFFKGLGKHPRFHKFGVNDSFRMSGGVFIGYDFVQLPILGKVKLKEKGYIKIPDGAVKVPIAMATVSREADRWFVSFAYVTDVVPVNADKAVITDDEYDIVGVDLGIKDLAITSCGEVIANPAAYHKQMQRLRRYQRAVSRKKKGSKNRQKAVARLAKLHRRITNIRKNSSHQCTASLTRKLAPKVLVIETLKPKNMAMNRKLAGSIMDANFGRIHEQLEYKCKWNNIQLIKAPQFYPSSQICSECGCFQKKDLKLTDREWTCPHCGCHHDRDVNAARNLRFYGVWLYGFVQSTPTARYAANACPVGKCRREGNGSEPCPRDLRLQFFETQEQCKSLKQELNPMNPLT